MLNLRVPSKIRFRVEVEPGDVKEVSYRGEPQSVVILHGVLRSDFYFLHTIRVTKGVHSSGREVQTSDYDVPGRKVL